MKPANEDGSVIPTKIDCFVEVAAGILGDDQDPRRKALIRLVVRKAVLADGQLSLSGDPADLAKAVAACKENQGYVVPSFVREWRTGLDENGHWKISGLATASGNSRSKQIGLHGGTIGASPPST
jgi:hypothetical protein